VMVSAAAVGLADHRMTASPNAVALRCLGASEAFMEVLSNLLIGEPPVSKAISSCCFD
jgi:hypothetical protein